MTGTLVVVGTGIGAAQLTAEARAAIESADEVHFLVPDPISAQGIEQLNPNAISLEDCYVAGEHRRLAYARMVERILSPVRAGRGVCAAFYGHPGVFVLPSHEAIAQARREGFDARMLPGVSAEDCLFADLGVDPSTSGCQSYEATRFLDRRPRVEPTAALILWQIGVVGSAEHTEEACAPRLPELVGVLGRLYGDEHEVVVYESSSYPGVAAHIEAVPVARLAEAVTPASTLYVPPRDST